MSSAFLAIALVVIFLLLTTPVASHAIARAIYRGGGYGVA